MPVLTLDQIESLCFDALKRAGASDEQAAIVAEEIMTPRPRASAMWGSATYTCT